MTSTQFTQAIRRLGWNQTDAARHLRLSQGHVSHIVKGHRAPGEQTAMILALLLLDEHQRTHGEDTTNDVDQSLLAELEALNVEGACFPGYLLVS
jgi:hypothetical protein